MQNLLIAITLICFSVATAAPHHGEQRHQSGDLHLRSRRSDDLRSADGENVKLKAGDHVKLKAGEPVKSGEGDQVKFAD
ncbi:unnamed protein product, partial [Rotaria magnacalcarata]